MLVSLKVAYPRSTTAHILWILEKMCHAARTSRNVAVSGSRACLRSARKVLYLRKGGLESSVPSPNAGQRLGGGDAAHLLLDARGDPRRCSRVPRLLRQGKTLSRDDSHV